VPGGIIGPPCEWGTYKYRDLVVDVATWTRGSRPCCVKNITVAKSEEVKTGSNLAESSEEDYGLNRAVLPVMMLMMNQ
jgi:hypothetical protein